MLLREAARCCADDSTCILATKVSAKEGGSGGTSCQTGAPAPAACKVAVCKAGSRCQNPPSIFNCGTGGNPCPLGSSEQSCSDNSCK